MRSAPSPTRAATAATSPSLPTARQRIAGRAGCPPAAAAGGGGRRTRRGGKPSENFARRAPPRLGVDLRPPAVRNVVTVRDLGDVEAAPPAIEDAALGGMGAEIHADEDKIG